jgi:hypothetical protein
VSGYTRNDVTNQIANGNTVDAVPLDGEFDAVQAAFAAVGGHRHNGTAGEGAPITVIGPTQDVVASGNSLTPKTDNAIDLGSSSFEWKDLYIDGTANIDSLVADAADINGGTIDGTVIGGTSPAAITGTTVAATDLSATNITVTNLTVGGTGVVTPAGTQTLTNKTINLANNTLVATSSQLAASVSDETGSGALVFATSPALSGVPTAPTAAAATNTTQIATTAHVFAERSNTATLTNKTLTSPTISGGTISGITDLAIADGGTGASDAAGALVNLGLTATAVELNTLDGITASTAELNVLDGVTASTAELNILDGVTASTAELNTLDGITATTAELNVLDGIAGIASQVEAEAGTATDKLMTPERTKQAIDALVTTSAVLAATAAASFGAVGTYAMVYVASTGFAEGATFAGSSLSPAGFYIDTSGISNDSYSSVDLTRGGSALSGTWRMMGRSNKDSSNSRVRANIALRIS